MIASLERFAAHCNGYRWPLVALAVVGIGSALHPRTLPFLLSLAASPRAWRLIEPIFFLGLGIGGAAAQCLTVAFLFTPDGTVNGRALFRRIYRFARPFVVVLLLLQTTLFLGPIVLSGYFLVTACR